MKNNSEIRIYETQHFIGYVLKHNITGVIIGVDSNEILGFVQNFTTERRIRTYAGNLEVFDSIKGEFQVYGKFVEKVKFSYNFNKIKKYWNDGGKDIFIHKSIVPYRKKEYFVLNTGVMSENAVNIAITDFRNQYDPDKTRVWKPVPYRGLNEGWFDIVNKCGRLA